ncbi:MAG: hypothetical protein V4534_01825 [Myxococcota bacterium]
MKGFFKKLSGSSSSGSISKPGEDKFQYGPPHGQNQPKPAPESKNLTDPGPQFENEILLRGRLGNSPGLKPKKNKDKEKEDAENTEPQKPDNLEAEYVQIMTINVNKKLDDME